MDRYVTRLAGPRSGPRPKSVLPAQAQSQAKGTPPASPPKPPAKRQRLEKKSRIENKSTSSRQQHDVASRPPPPPPLGRNQSTEEEEEESRAATPAAGIPKHRDSGIQAAFEKSAMTETKTKEEAILEYENSRAVELAAEEAHASHDQTRGEEKKEMKPPPRRMWIKGQSSIYVDAFNLALNTVLEDESHLFDTRETTVFEAWRGLEYEAQYLYVRLFLRKTATWHRTNRLGYYNDISNPELAIATLQTARPLPHAEPPRPSQREEGAPEEQDIMLGEEFTFADDSANFIDSVEEAAGLLSLDELKGMAKEAKIRGKNKGDLLRAFCENSARQMDLPWQGQGLKRSTSADSAVYSTEDDNSPMPPPVHSHPPRLERRDSSRGERHLDKILDIVGSCIRLSEAVHQLFERVHLVFYRSTEWTEKSLTTIILAKMSRRNFPEYIVDRSSNIFPSRQHLLEYEAAIRLESQVDTLLEGPAAGTEGKYRAVLDIFQMVHARWKILLQQEEIREMSYEFNEGCYLRRFNAAHTYTRVVHKAAWVCGRLKMYEREHELLGELLGQGLFYTNKRGGWWQRRALVEENYMWAVDTGGPEQPSGAGAAAKGSSKDKDGGKKEEEEEEEKRRKSWKKRAKETCEMGLQDGDCHLIYHYDLQKRLLKLERWLKIPRREQHDFGHVRLARAEDHVVEGIQVKSVSAAAEAAVRRPGMPSTKTVWVDQAPLGMGGGDGGGGRDGSDGNRGGKERHCSVEEMCLTHYRSRGWKGYHSEGGILRTLFAHLFYDVLFMYVPNVFQTPFQSAPLDLNTDGFYKARMREVESRVAELCGGGDGNRTEGSEDGNGNGNRRAVEILKRVYEGNRERRTSAAGLNWEFGLEDLVELVGCFPPGALGTVCKVLAQEYGGRGGGVPDLVLWRITPGVGEEVDGGEEKETRELMFVEVKSVNDRLSDTQRLWIHVLTGAGVRVARAQARAREVREVP
ncbi:uncharacterized protein MKZ38_004829 [Zalerion maritima]|uniref:Fanconi-associated nuclease n=1 Tax=Zalerion maritima TaxID=339359 RepID=A0AAD5WQT4_9PEZI|nr:uncharacterized protein MKZ38_004829 [Zalerion maritima]